MHRARVESVDLVTIHDSDVRAQAVDWLRKRIEAGIDRGIYRVVSKAQLKQLRTKAPRTSRRPNDQRGCLTLILAYTALMQAFLLHHELPAGSVLDRSPLFQSGVFALFTLALLLMLVGRLTKSSLEKPKTWARNERNVVATIAGPIWLSNIWFQFSH
ncbi:MAG: hypothetical protein ACPGVU_13220 [Limisphaerales bacterium]